MEVLLTVIFFCFYWQGVVRWVDAGDGGVAVDAGVSQRGILIAAATHASSISTRVLFPNHEGNPWRRDPPRESPKEAF